MVFLEGGEERGKELRGDDTVSRMYYISQIPNLRGFDLYYGLKEVRLNPFQQGRTWRSEVKGFGLQNKAEFGLQPESVILGEVGGGHFVPVLLLKQLKCALI